MVCKPNAAVLFDIDDTLAPTSRFINTVINESVRTMTAAGLKVDDIEHAVATLHQIRASGQEHAGIDFNLLCYTYNTPQIQIPRIVKAGVDEYHRIRDVLLKPNPYSEEILEHLTTQGYILGVVTNGNPTKQHDKLLYLHLQKFFGKYFYASIDTAVMKPNPTMLLKALEDMAAEPARSYIVGDRPEDVLAGHRAGMKAIRYLSGHHSGKSPVSTLLSQGIAGEDILFGKYDDRIAELTPEHIITDLREIRDIIK